MFEPVAWVWDLDFNPRPPWGGRRAVVQDFHIPASYFNPRPPWGGRPETQGKRRAIIGDFNPRPPWGGRRVWYKSFCNYSVFQSTPSVGRATVSPLSPFKPTSISIHALRGEGDCRRRAWRYTATIFQSTPSVGRATLIKRKVINITAISIHALRGEGDIIAFVHFLILRFISIHALRGEGD